jgi:UDP-GlcNAc:undecaprenyl-phosphate GlcNAc-1-phosphate transferase
MIRYLGAFLLSFSLSIFITPLIIKFSHRYGFIADPREDRWHKKPTALLGGIGIFLSFIIPFLIFIPLNKLTIGIFLCSLLIFGVGLYDDLKEVKPYTKFIVQIILSIVVIFLGISIKIIPYPIIAIPLTIFWIVGITNAVNILDNMDGLASGISFISSGCIFLYALQNNLPLVALFSSIIAGPALGFLKFNFNPAKIFMGDSGSLFLGFILSIITIIGTWKEATNLLFSIIVPLSVMVIPIFDTTLVTFQRKIYGRRISQGGKDHSSHRLVFLGISEKKAVLILMAFSLLFGLTIILMSRLNFFTTIIIFCLLSVFLLFFGIFLGEVKVYGEKAKGTLRRKNLIISTVILYKKQMLQVIIDIILVNIAYVSAYLLRYEGTLSDFNLRLIETSLPIIILTKFAMFSILGLYREEWRYVGIRDMIQVFKSVSFGSLLSITILLILYRFEGYSRAVFINDYILTLLMIGGVRVLIRVFKEYFSTTVNVGGKIPILIMGAGDGGELLIREIRNNSKINYKAMGFIDDDLEKKGKIIHGLKVLGTRNDIPTIVKSNGIKKILISILSIDKDQLQDIYEICKRLNIECERIRPIIEI